MTKDELLNLLLQLEDLSIGGELGSLWFDNPSLPTCWRVQHCSKKKCPAYGRQGIRCWHVVGTFCHSDTPMKDLRAKHGDCRNCIVFKAATPSEEIRARELLNNIIFSLTCFEPTAIDHIKIRNRLPEITYSYDLTTREKEVLLFVLDRWSRRQIAKALSISSETVKMHVRNIYRKLGVGSRDEALNKLRSTEPLSTNSMPPVSTEQQPESLASPFRGFLKRSTATSGQVPRRQ